MHFPTPIGLELGGTPLGALVRTNTAQGQSPECLYVRREADSAGNVNCSSTVGMTCRDCVVDGKVVGR